MGSRYYALFTLRVGPLLGSGDGPVRAWPTGKAMRKSGDNASTRFDAFKLAASGGRLEGTIPPQALPRLGDRLAERLDEQAGTGSGTVGNLAWRIRGERDEEGRPALEVSIEGVIPLTCQRCLEPVDERVGQSTVLLIAHGEAELASLDEASVHEVVLADGPLDAIELVEDELLLTLPFAPRHPACAGAAAAADGTTEE